MSPYKSGARLRSSSALVSKSDKYRTTPCRASSGFSAVSIRIMRAGEDNTCTFAQPLTETVWLSNYHFLWSKLNVDLQRCIFAPHASELQSPFVILGQIQMQAHFQNATYEHDKLTFKVQCTESTIMTFFAKHSRPNSCIYMTNSSVSFFWEGNDTHYLHSTQGDPE